MRINTNLTAMNTHTQYTKNNNNIAKAVEKLSSGYSINSAADNAAGLAISEKMRAQIRGLEQAATNSQDAISLVQTAEGGLNETTEVLQRMRELAVQSANDTNENEIDREALQDEFDQLQLEINSIAKSTSFNKKTVLDGTMAQYRAKTANLNLANSGLSVNLGNVAAGSYSFEAVVKTEKAAVAAQDAVFTATTTSDAISVESAITNSLTGTALPNGNYTMEASYNAETYELTVAAKGDNGQTFTAVVDKTALDNFRDNGTNITLNFANGGTTAFSFDISYTGSFTTENAASVQSFADLLSSSMSVSASGGVDASAAKYALYATLTGAEDVKLEAGMSSVSFTNGVTVNFDELTTSDVTIPTNTDGTPDIDSATYEYRFGKIATAADAAPEGWEDAATNTTKTASLNITTNLSADNTQPIGTTGAAALTGDLKVGDLTIDLDDLVTDNSISDTTTGAQLAGFIQDALAAAATTHNTAGVAADADYTKYSETTGDYTVTFAADGTMSISTDANEQTYVPAVAVGDASHQTSSFEVELAEGDGITFQIGANKGDELKIYIEEMSTEYLGIASASILTRTSASEALTTVDSALNQVASQRAYLGAMQNRLEHKIANLETAAQNLTDAESTIRDVDMAKQMTEFTNANILSQAATAMLAQANSLPQGVLSLLQG